MRRRKTDIDMNLDSLLDTMTNVVGILVILLAVTQLGVGEAIKQFVGGGETAEVTYEEVDEETKKLEELQIKLNELREQYDLNKINLEQMQRDLNKYRQLLTEFDQLSPSIKSMDFSNLEYEVKRLRERFDELNKEIARLDEAIKDKESRRAQKYSEGPDVTYVNIPVLTPLSEVSKEKLTQVSFICRNGRICPFDVVDLIKNFDQAVLRVIGQRRGKTITLDNRDIINIQKYFANHDIGNEYFQLKTDGNLRIFQSRRSDQGETIQQLQEPDSTFMNEIKRLNPKRHYVYFYVWSDSFDTYNSALKIIKEKKNPRTNWFPFSKDVKLMDSYISSPGIGSQGRRDPMVQW